VARPSVAIVDRSEVFSKSPEEGVPDLAFGGLRAVLDLRKQLRFDPDALVRDPLGVGLGFPDEGLQPSSELGRRGFVEPVVDLACVDKIGALSPSDVESVPLGAVEGEARDGQRLALSAGLLDPVVAASLWGADVNFQVTVLKILAAYPDGFAVMEDLKRDMAILATSGRDWADRTRRLAAKAPDLDIWSQGLVERLSGGWKITGDATATFLLESVRTQMRMGEFRPQ